MPRLPSGSRPKTGPRWLAVERRALGLWCVDCQASGFHRVGCPRAPKGSVAPLAAVGAAELDAGDDEEA